MRKQRAETLKFSLQSSFWFVPVLTVIGAVVCVVLFLQLDRLPGSQDFPGAAWLYSGGPDGAYAMLAMIAGSMATIAGVVFSITIVALTLTASRYGPRLPTNFMRDRGNHFVFGAFIATFVYCLIVIGMVRNGSDEFIPRFAVTAAPVFAAADMFFFIYFIHHTASILRVDYLIYLVEKDLDGSLETLYPENIGIDESETPAADGNLMRLTVSAVATRIVEAAGTGYIRSMDFASMFEYACAHDLILKVEKRPGDFTVPGSRLATIIPAGEPVRTSPKTGGDDERNILKMIAIGPQRNPIQDIEFSIGQLVEISIRALSPAVNDTFTALTCIDRLCSALVRLVTRKIPSVNRYDAEGKFRMAVPTVGFGNALDAAFTLIRQNAGHAVIMKLLGCLETIASHMRKGTYEKLLEEQADLLRRAARNLSEKADRHAVKLRHEAVLRMLYPAADR